MRHRVAVFVSGTGRHLENFARLAESGELDVELVLALADREGTQALERARRAGVQSLVLDPERRLDAAAFSQRAFDAARERGAQTILLAGFLRLLTVPEEWNEQVLNIHPALLPAFGGRGYYGERVHRAVLERGCQFSGCTVHYVDNEYDHGHILLQRVTEVCPGDTAADLARRVFEQELIAFPEALRLHMGTGGG